MKRAIICLATVAAVSGLPAITSGAVAAATPLCPLADAGYAAGAPAFTAAKPGLEAARAGGAAPVLDAINSGLLAFDGAVCGPRA